VPTPAARPRAATRCRRRSLHALALASRARARAGCGSFGEQCGRDGAGGVAVSLCQSVVWWTVRRRVRVIWRRSVKVVRQAAWGHEQAKLASSG
jgi:hypothetical protein